MDPLKEHSTFHLPIMVETDEDGISILSCPACKGCHSYGKTIEEGMKTLKEVIAMCLEEQKPTQMNQFFGFRELEVTA